MANNTNNILASSDEAMLNFVTAIIEQAGRIMLDEKGAMYFIDGIQFHGDGSDKQLVVLSEGQRYVIYSKDSDFFVKLPPLEMTSGNDSNFGELQKRAC